MKRFNIIFLLVVSFQSVTTAFTLDPAIKLSVNTVIQHFVNGEYDVGLATIDSLEQKGIASPLAAMVRVWGIGLRDMDFDQPTDSAEFLPAYRLAQLQIDKQEKEEGKTTYVLTMRGFAKATYASWCMRMKKYKEGIQVGFDALDILKEAKRLDTTNTDVDFFLGLYDCAKTEMSRKFSFVTFWYPAEYDRGINALLGCASSSEFASLGALMVLPDVMSSAKRYTQTDSLLTLLVKRFPQSRFVYWSIVKTHVVRKKYARAIEAAHSLSVLYAPFPQAKRSHAAVLFELVKLNMQSGNKPMALSTTNKLTVLYGKETQSYYKDLCSSAQRLVK